VGTLLALRARETTGEGQVVDLALFETIFRMLDELAPAYQQFGIVRERMGADTVNVLPHSHYRCRDGRWLAIACTNDEMFRRLAGVMGRPELADDDRWGPKQRRLEQRDEVNAAVAAWVGSVTCDEALVICREAQVPAGPLNSIADIFEDPTYVHRETIVEVPSRIGPLAVPNTLPAMSGTPGEIRWLGQALGADTDAVLGELLHRTTAQIAQLRADGVI
jgi:crotonobetainyl-CoA:carnitine CoA-transferase CaiB-like acyl-CoA transferase